MDKRYQVFISSTYSDLREERSKVIQTIMSLDCIPAGMELFPAIDASQLDFIKKVIDDCDYYVLIIGGRYGSIDEDGISYTEKEYDYAVSKGIPVMAFLHEDISKLSLECSEIDTNKRKCLETFRAKVSSGRLVQFWNNADDLNGKVAVSLTKTIKTYPAEGWVRASVQTNAESLQELNDLRKEVDKLREYKRRSEGELSVPKDIADWDELFSVRIKHIDNPYSSTRKRKPLRPVTLSWGEWFKLIGIYIKEQYDTFGNNTDTIKGVLRNLNSRQYYDVNPEIEDVATIGYQFICYGVMKTSTSFNGEIWALTSKGEKMLATMMCVKTTKQKS